jgi:hypothetical protein
LPFHFKSDIDAGSTRVVNETTTMTGPAIGQGAAINVPAGKNQIMTVDGMKKIIKPIFFVILHAIHAVHNDKDFRIKKKKRYKIGTKCQKPIKKHLAHMT